MEPQVHYTYFITNNDKMKYIGVRSCYGDPTQDDYWGSSNYVPKNIRETGIKEIIETFDTRELAMAHEIELHKKWQVAGNPWFYNKAMATSTKFNFDFTGHKHSEETKKNMSERALKIMKGSGNPRWGCHHTDETKAKIGAAHKGKVVKESTKAKLREMYLGKEHPANSVKWSKTCEHCNKTFQKGHYVRWHGDNCKMWVAHTYG